MTKRFDGYLRDLPPKQKKAVLEEGAELLWKLCDEWGGVSSDFAVRYLAKTFCLPSQAGTILYFAKRQNYVSIETQLGDEEPLVTANLIIEMKTLSD
jgi:hypothetical protein